MSPSTFDGIFDTPATPARHPDTRLGRISVQGFDVGLAEDTASRSVRLALGSRRRSIWLTLVHAEPIETLESFWGPNRDIQWKFDFEIHEDPEVSA